MESSSTPDQPQGNRLDSWKEIAAYLNRDVRTVQRWEKTAALPVRRLSKPGLRAVYAYTADLDRWQQEQEVRPTALDEPSPAVSPSEQEPAAADDTEPATDARNAVSGVAPAVAPRIRPASLLVAAAVILLAVGAIAAVALRDRPSAPPPFGPFTARPITAEPGSEFEPDVSPDGKYVVYVSSPPSDTRSLMIRPVVGGEARTLVVGGSGPQQVRSPVWSPDGTRIAFIRGQLMEASSIVLVSALGGTERPLLTVHPYPRRRTLMIAHLLAWSPDGKYLVASNQETPGRSALVRINVDTAERTPITSPDNAQFDVEPTLSSDGRLLLFNRVRGEFLSDAYVQPLDASLQPAGPARKLQSAGNWNGTPRLIESRQDVLTASGAIPRFTLYRQPLDGSAKPEPVGVISDNAASADIDPLSGRIVVATSRAPIDVLRFAATATSLEPRPPDAEEIVESTYVDRSAVYSPDGSRIAFQSDRNGSRQIWVADADGSRAVELSQPFEVGGPMPAWSADASRIAYAGIGPNGNSQMYIVNVATNQATKVSDDTLDYVSPVWSPDGTHLYSAASEQGAYALYRLPVEGGPAERLADGHVNVIGTTADGTGIYAVRRDARARPVLELVSLPSGQRTTLATMNFIDDAWATPAGLYYLARRDEAQQAPLDLIFRTHAGATTTRAAFSAPPGRGLSVSPDGRYAVTTRTGVTIADLLLLEPAR